MRLVIAFAAGAAAGYWYATRSDEERRAELEAALDRVKANPTYQQVVDTGSKAAQGAVAAGKEKVQPLIDKADEADSGDEAGSGSSGSSASSSS